MDLFHLRAKLTLDMDEYKKGIDDAKKEGDGFAESVDKKLKPVTLNAWIEIGKKVLEIAQKIGQLVIQTMNYADNVGDLAAKFGISSDAVSELQYIADQSSSSVEMLTNNMAMLYMRAKQNGEVFNTLGISVQDANGDFKSMDNLFWEVLGTLNDLEDENAKNAYMLDFFGRSAMQAGEVFRKTTPEITKMRQEAHDLGIVMNEETLNYASDFNDTMAVLKLQGQSALASLVAGAPDAEEKLQNFFDSVLEMLDNYIPDFVNFGLRLIIQVALAMIRIAPSLAYQLFDMIIETIFSINWLQVGIDIAKSIVEGMINVLVSALNIFGLNIPRVNFEVGENLFEPTPSNSGYSINNTTTNKIEVDINASGNTPVDKKSAEETAKALAPYIDKMLGGK